MKLSLPITVVMLCSVAVAQPSITSGAVLNVSSAQPILAPNAMFAIYGNNLGPSSIEIAPPLLQTPLGGTSVTFTPAGGGAAISPKLYVSLANAVVGVLPSSTPPGTYAVRVTYNSQISNAQDVTVVARHFGIATANGFGFGVAQATIATVNGGYGLTRFTSSGASGSATFVNSPAHANDTVTLWGTGGGADPANDNGGSSGDQSGNFRIILAGQTITPSYAAAVARYPGLWQINFTVPANATPDCFTTVQVSTDGELSNAVTVPIAAAGQNACTDSFLTQAQLERLDAGGDIVGGGISASKVTGTSVTSILGQTITQTATTENVAGGFGRYNAADYVGRFGQRNMPPCFAYDVTGNPSLHANTGMPHAYLNAGASLPVAGSGLSPNAAMLPVSGPVFTVYNLDLLPGTLTAGTYTVTGNGGPEVGPFSASLTFPGSFTVANWDNIATINRGQSFTVNWTGGGTESVVVTLLGTATVSGSPQDPTTQVIHLVTIVCRAAASAQTFTIPASLMSLLPSTSFDAASGSAAILSVVATSNVKSSQFTATLTGGGQLDYGFWVYSLGFSRNVELH